MTIIAILGGTGHGGSGLALRWAAAGHTVLIGSRAPEKATDTVLEQAELLAGEWAEG